MHCNIYFVSLLCGNWLVVLLKNNREVNALTIKQKAMFFTKITNYCRASLFIIFIITLLVACGQDPVDNGDDGTGTDTPENSDG
ncbi:MAG: hypothetical protein II307_01040, partial [Alistipes sp.]|nr:hypothetical protein [Alistipes sp.]